MKCSKCGFENPDGFAFCGQCGTALSTPCPQCGFKNPSGFAFCGQCGAPLETGRERLTSTELDHLRTYLPGRLVEELQLSPLSPPPRLLESCTSHLSDLLRTVYTLLPTYLVEQIIQNPVPGQAGGQFVHGTLLFADISGFTAMSEKLSRIGHEGAEEITAIVNRYFGTMLSILRDHAGQLVKFGGDALLGLFIEPDSTTRAVQAAHRMQEAMVGFAQTSTSQGVFALQMKVGIHRGRFFAAQLGTSEGMEYALFGADVNRTAAAESAAVAGQVLLDQASRAAIQVPCQAAPAPPPQDERYIVVQEIDPPPHAAPPFSPTFTPQPTLDNLRQAIALLDTLTPYMPSDLLARIVSDPHAASLEGEHRLVAVLFANVLGLGDIADQLGPGREEQIVTALNQYFVAMSQGIRRFGGVINKMDLYDHGDKLLALFGAPIAHEDDAERAVRAALTMQETLAEQSATLPSQIGLPDLHLTQQVGISFGFVFAGYVGTDWRHEYTVMGDEVNLGARLMSAAEPDTIIVSSDVRRKVQALFNLDPRGEVQLKGKSMPIPIFSVVGPRAMPEPVRGLEGMRSPLVGRQAEWEQLQNIVNLLLTGRGQIVPVMGEAGLGKSRLVTEMRQRLIPNQVHWIEGRCLSYTESVSFRPFQDIVQQLVNIQSNDSEVEAWGKLRQALEEILTPEEIEVTLPYLANFLNLQMEEGLQEKIRYLDAEPLQRRTFIAISTLIEAQSTPQAPLILVLEDIHWMDQASRALLEHILPLVDRVPLTLLLLFRPERTKGCWQIYEKATREFAHCTTEIPLHHLEPTDRQQLLVNLIGISEWPPAVQEIILERTEGNPLYIEEVIRTLIDDHVLIQDNASQWQLRGDVEAISMPDTLQGVLMARLDRLEEPSRWTAQLASVVGRVFPFDILAHIVPENDNRLNRSLVQLQQYETIRETRRMPELLYTFKHAMMQEVCYRSLLTRTRRQYHRKIATYLATSRSAGRRDTESNIPLIAHHAFIGQDWQRALRYQMEAGQQAKKLFANQGAIEHFENALCSAEHLDESRTVEQRQAIHASLGELLIITGQYDHARDHLDRSLALAVERDDQDAQAHACRWFARMHELRGEYPTSFDWIRRGLDVLGERETAEAAELLLIAGLIHTRQGEYDKALGRCQDALRIAQDLGQLTVLARAYNLLGHITRLRGASTSAIEHFQQAFDLYERAGDIQGQATVHNQIANARFDLGQWQEASHHYRRAREIFEQTGDVYNHVIADNNLGGIARNQGRLDDALAFYQEGLASLKQIGGSLFVQGALHMNLGATFVRRGEIEAARQHLEISQNQFEQAQVRDFLPELYRHFAQAALVAGDLTEAQSYGEQSLQLAQELEMRGEEGTAQRVLGEIAQAQGQFEQAIDRMESSISILQEVGDEYEGACSYLSLARVCTSLENVPDGLAAIENCTDVFRRLDAILDLASARQLKEALTKLQARSTSPKRA